MCFWIAVFSTCVVIVGNTPLMFCSEKVKVQEGNKHCGLLHAGNECDYPCQLAKRLQDFLYNYGRKSQNYCFVRTMFMRLVALKKIWGG
ncbi:unnamed protein product [Acanthoscelides obtectus]|uniref:Secreted protein n=1 Tax=Acanthoscelides obtectus TaxID=200917 RepID=A0A9P0LST1_ACAOB|nr:unnamed protein product [Acanthoscelides obtectus]CAK1675229.1 hypothetical protein AOBTE_LOCUS30070 [Acanthoscelides obtectus]